jgi:hypothetical protein
MIHPDLSKEEMATRNEAAYDKLQVHLLKHCISSDIYGRGCDLQRGFETLEDVPFLEIPCDFELEKIFLIGMVFISKYFENNSDKQPHDINPMRVTALGEKYELECHEFAARIEGAHRQNRCERQARQRQARSLLACSLLEGDTKTVDFEEVALASDVVYVCSTSSKKRSLFVDKDLVVTTKRKTADPCTSSRPSTPPPHAVMSRPSCYDDETLTPERLTALETLTNFADISQKLASQDDKIENVMKTLDHILSILQTTFSSSSSSSSLLTRAE